jgi:hypothetical protein
MEDQIRNALADKDYALAQSLADDWLSLAPDVAVAHYLAAWARDAQGSEEILRRGIQDYGDASEFAAFLALTLYSAGRFREAISILLQLVADTATDVQVKRYERALRYYAAHPDAE